MGQGTLVDAAGLAALDLAMLELSCSELTRGAEHARQLRTVLVLAEAHAAVGWELAIVPQIALSLGCSENRATKLLSQAQALVVLPGATEAVECGLLAVEQSVTVIEQLAVLDPAGQVAVWARLQQRLIAAADGTVAPPSRLADLLRRWGQSYDKESAARRRQEAQRSGGVDYRKSSDGLVDLFARGLTAPDAQVILSRIAARSRPWGSEDDRTADQRRLDAFRDLLLGRDRLPLIGDDEPPPRCVLRAHGAAPCGCLPGQPVPCGAEVAVLMPPPRRARHHGRGCRAGRARAAGARSARGAAAQRRPAPTGLGRRRRRPGRGRREVDPARARESRGRAGGAASVAVPSAADELAASTSTGPSAASDAVRPCC